MGQNLLEKVPATFGGLRNLTRLYLHKNKLVALPDLLFSRLQSLSYLSLHENDLSELPDDVGALISLGQLYVHGNGLVDLPSSVCELHRLRLLSVDDFVASDAAEVLKAMRSSGCRIKLHVTAAGEAGRQERRRKHAAAQQKRAAAAPSLRVSELEPYTLPPLPPSPSDESDSD